MITELKELALENHGTYYAELFGLKYSNDMPDLSKDPTIIKRAQEAAEVLNNSTFPPELIELMKR